MTSGDLKSGVSPTLEKTKEVWKGRRSKFLKFELREDLDAADYVSLGKYTENLGHLTGGDWEREAIPILK